MATNSSQSSDKVNREMSLSIKEKCSSSRGVHIVIVGGGLAGLTCARRLTELLKNGTYQIRIIEARDRIGGRTSSIDQLNLDMGASWNFPSHNAVRSLARELNIPTIEQFEHGDSLFDRGSASAQRVSMQSSYGNVKRLKGGTVSLCKTIFEQLTKNNEGTVTVQLNSPLINIRYNNDQTILLTLGDTRQILADYVVLALPPKLLTTSITFNPSLPSSISQQLSRCITWMGSMCKIILVYDRAWWKEKNLSGFACSRRSRAQEWHDASSDTCNALFAFCISGTTPQQMIDDTVKIFGNEAKNPTAFYMTDWSQEQFTSSSSNDGFDGYQGVDDTCRQALWNGQLWFGNSEISDVDGGVLEGAVRRGTEVAQQLAQIIKNNNHTLKN